MSLNYFGENELRLLEGGEEFFPELLKAVDDSQQSILIDVYIFNQSKIGTDLLASLVKAANRGVEVSLVIDGLARFRRRRHFFKL